MRVPMRRIDPPSFAPEYSQREEVSFYDGVTLREYQQLQQHWEAILASAHAAIEAHLHECALDDPDLFPYRAALSGEYYFDKHVSHMKAGSLRRVSVMLEARCLGYRPQRSPTPMDYCAIGITLLFDPDEIRFETFYTDHRVIG